MTIKGNEYCSRCILPIGEDRICPHCGYDPQTNANATYMLEDRTLLAERYLIGAAVGTGGFGITYAAWDKSLEIPVAIKEFYPKNLVTRNIDEDDEITILPGEKNRLYFQIGLDHFEREAHVLAMLHSEPGTVTVHNWFCANGTAYLVMEYLRGETLHSYCARTEPSYQTLLKMLRQPIDALVTCHKQGVLHRDISPENLFVLEDGTVKVIDFGAAVQQVQADGHTVVLNRKFAPIEQYDAKGHMGPWSDVYAMCATLYALTAGETAPESPIRTNGAPLKRLSIPYDQNAVIARGMAVQPEDRIQSMEELRSRLYHLPLPEEIIRHRRFVRRFTTAAIAILLAAAIVAFNFITGLPLGYGLLFSLRGDGWHVKHTTVVQAELEMPSSLLGIPVTVVDDEAFMGKEGLMYITLPESIESVGDKAFYGLPDLQTVTLPEGISTIGKAAFASCPQLHTFVVPYSLQQIAPDALKGASAHLGIWGERDMPAYGLLSGEGQPPFFVRSEYEIEPNETGVTLLKYTDGLAGVRPDEWTLVFPSYVDGKPVTRFAESSKISGSPGTEVCQVLPTARTIVFPEHLEQIESLYYNVTYDYDWPQFIFSDNLKSIGAYAFADYCQDPAFRNLVFPLPEKLVSIEDFAFSDSQVTQYTLPSTLEHIGYGAFSGNDYLETITLPDSVREVEEEAFAWCDALQYVRLSAGMTAIREGTFSWTGSLETVFIPDGIETIEDYAFSDSQIEYLYLPDTVKKIGKAFQFTPQLRYIRIPAEAVIAEGAFTDSNPELIIAGYPNSDAQRYAEEYGFRFEDVSRWNAFPNTSEPGCIHITAEAGDNIVCASFDREKNAIVTQVVGYSVIKDDWNLSSLELPLLVESVSNLGSHKNLTSITLPETIRTIDDNAFKSTGLKSITIPPLAQLGPWSFADCEHLTTVSFGDFSTIRTLTNVFSGSALETIKLPYSLHTMNQEFSGCQHLQFVEIQEGCRQIINSFDGCEKLPELRIPSTVDVFSCKLFGCYSLTDLWFMGSKTTINPLDTLHFYEWDDEWDDVRTSENTYCTPTYDALTIHGYPGSTAQAYAELYGLNFEPIEDTFTFEEWQTLSAVANRIKSIAVAVTEAWNRSAEELASDGETWTGWSWE